ncbi:MAG: hypothetical protein WCF67_22810, partial [Chitinophagaceae bacterium]
PGSDYALPLVSDESKKEHQVLKDLFNKDYSMFIMSSAVQNEIKKSIKKDGANGIMTVSSITINYDALKRHLEKKSIIRKFGF